MSTTTALPARIRLVRQTWRSMSTRGRFWAIVYVAGIEPWSWMEDALVSSAGDTCGLLGECDDGNIYLPSRTRSDWWDRRYNWRNPTHWPYYLRSRLTHRVVMLEAAADGDA